jgi:patatin-like phospholipase/acyl hydrolase
MQCRYRVVVSIDGGGIRGILPLRLIEYIQNTISEYDPEIDPSSWVDVYAATSTGTIISGALMMKNGIGETIHSPGEIMNLYMRRGEQFFAKAPQHLTSGSQYPLHFMLDHFFGSTKLGDLDKHFMFFSYDLNEDEPYFFNDSMSHLNSMPLAKMMAACSAFPGVFPPLKMGHRLLADGILATKNPAKMAYDYARMYYPKDPIILISLGTGTDESLQKDVYELESNKTDDALNALTHEDRNLIYFRFQPEIVSASKDLSDASRENAKKLLQDVNAYIDSHKTKFDQLFRFMKIKVEQY